jgi:outer membrane protein assembly factor BamB
MVWTVHNGFPFDETQLAVAEVAQTSVRTTSVSSRSLNSTRVQLRAREPFRNYRLLFIYVFVCSWSTGYADTTTDWPAFRGPGGRGIAEGFTLPTDWNADPDSGQLQGIRWQIPVPGLGHSSPVIFGDRIFLITAVASAGKAELKVGTGGDPNAADDNEEQTWLVLCYDKKNGQEIWRKSAYQGKPRATRHAKATHANTSVSVSEDGKYLLAFLGSEGLYCYDLDGQLIWQRDLGTINISKYGIGWGFASSPSICGDRIALVCDDPSDPFVMAMEVDTGKDIWRVSRKEICERSWGTPLIHANGKQTQVVVNGWPWIVSYDLDSGDELWRVEGGGDNPVPTPFEAHGWFYITNAHGADSPIYVVKPDARGDLTSKVGDTNEGLVWSIRRGGCYMSTPVVYGDYLYLGNSNGVVRCFHAKTGEKLFENRLGSNAGIIASLVAGDNKIYCASENGFVYVLAPGSEFKLLASNPVGEPCFATPALSEGKIYLRTTERLIAIE